MQSSTTGSHAAESISGEERDVACAAFGVAKVYGSGQAAVTALDNVDLEVGSGRFTAIMGPSGSGKSTLMHCLAGLDSVMSGRIVLGGTDITNLSDRRLTVVRRRHVGFVFQSFNLLPTLTAEQNIRLPLELAGQRPDEAWFAELVELLGLTERLQHRPGELSGGQQQRVALARALTNRPDVIFADEPTGNLDSGSGTEVLRLLRRSVRELGQTVVMVTHDPVAASYADRVVLLADGRIVGDVFEPTPDLLLGAISKSGA